MYARNGVDEEPVLENAPRFSLFYSHGKKAGPSLDAVEKELRDRLPQSEDVIRRKLLEAKKTGKITRILTNIPPAVALALMERRIFLPGVNVLVEPQRRARFGSLACHLLGYAGEVDEAELRRGRDQNLRPDPRGPESLRPGQWVGKNGLEKVYDGWLRGTDGGLQFEVDAMGRHLHVIRRIPSTPGNDIHLTMDRRLQSAAEAGLAASVTGRGGAVAIDPRTGAILALASAPGYDPSLNLGDYLGDPNLPFFNRALQGIYPPGSVFKIVTSAVALQNGWDTRRTFFCTGSYQMGNREFGCWTQHGRKDFLGAVAQSCDVYFYNMGRAVGADNLEAMAKAFGFGEKSGLDLPGESPGLVPGRTWKKQVLKQTWFEGDTLNFCIGQGALATTPLQNAVLLAAVANKGTVWRPFLVDRVISPDNKIVLGQNPKSRRRVVLDDRVWDMIHQALEEVVRQGSGQSVRRDDLVIGGKTGTAQNSHGDDHSWFAAYAGRRGETPGLALAVFVENGGNGSASAAPIAKQMIDAYYPPSRSILPLSGQGR
ncbi:MAG: penicillin-binding protein 2 [Elusimicrobia bacterium]|nr:penicillin-binding protein 2 [Elusimicrobiota bacterium]